jgi:hypothetical protein
MTIAEIEDKLLETIKALGLFATLQSVGRQDIPEAYAYPACFVFFAEDGDTEDLKDYATVTAFEVVVQVQNLFSAAAVNRDAYALLDFIKDAISGSNLGFIDAGPFRCSKRQLTGYDDSEGVAEYLIRLEVTWYRPA